MKSRLKFCLIRVGFATVLSVMGATSGAFGEAGHHLKDCGPLLEKLTIQLPKSLAMLKRGQEAFFSNASDRAANLKVKFFGRVVDEDGDSKYLLFFEPRTDLLHVVPISQVEMTTPNGSFDPHKSEATVEPERQEAEVCFQAATFGCLQALKIRGWNSPLIKKLQTAKGRWAIYDEIGKKLGGFQNPGMTNVDQFNNFEKLFKKWGIKYSFIPTDRPSSYSRLVKHLEKGGIALISYRVSLEDTQNIVWWGGTERRLGQPERLAVPAGNVNGPGHVVVALGMMDGKRGSKKVLVGDSTNGFFQLWDEKNLKLSAASDFDAFILISTK